MKLYDLHTHTTHSDGQLIPSESARRAEVAGYAGIAITDHADESNMLQLLEYNLQFKERFNATARDFKVIVGVELTHVHPDNIAELTEQARNNGADIVVVHGETIVEPVIRGTNRAAIEAKVDILAHPGLIIEDDVKLAVANGVALEVTTRRGHAYSNGHLVELARKHGAKLVVNNDAHSPDDYVGAERAMWILLGAGLTPDEANEVFNNNKDIFINKLGGKVNVTS